MPVFDPWEGFFAVRTEDCLGNIPEMLFRMEEVQDLDGLGKVFRGEVPDPGGSVCDDDLPGHLVEATPGALPQDAGGKVGRTLSGIEGSGAFNGGGIGGGALVPDGNTLVVGHLRAPDGAEFHLPCFGGSVGLFPRTVGELIAAHGDPRPVGPQVKGGGKSHDRIRVEAGPLVFGNLGTQNFGYPLHLLGADMKVGEFPEELSAFLEGELRSDDSGHAENAGSDRRSFQIQYPVLRKESLMTGRAEVVPADQRDRPQNGEKFLGMGSGVSGIFGADGTGKDGGGVLPDLVQMAFKNPGPHLERLGPEGLLQSFEIDRLSGLCSEQVVKFGRDLTDEVGFECFFLRIRRKVCPNFSA